jgi:hypothetical protein
MRLELPMADLVALDRQASAHVSGRGTGELDVLGSADRRLLLGVTGGYGVPLVARRVRLASVYELEQWSSALDAWLDAVSAAGLHMPPLGRQVVAPPQGGRVLWLLQPRLPDDTLLPAVLEAHTLIDEDPLEAILDTIIAVVRAGSGLDPRASAWGYLEGDLVYLDPSRPEPSAAPLPPELRAGPLRAWARWAWPVLRIEDELDRSRRVHSAVGVFLASLDAGAVRERGRQLAKDRRVIWTEAALASEAAAGVRRRNRLAAARRPG